MKLKEDILTLIQDLKKKQATSIEGIAARHVLNELEKEIQAMKPEKHEINLLFGETGNTLAFKQKFHIGDRVFYLENKPAGNGGFLRDAYILKDGIITEIGIVVESKLISRKKYAGKNFTGEPDIVRFAPKDYATGEYYHVNSAAGMKAAVGLFATEKEAEERFKEMKQEYPKMTLEKNIEGYEVEYV